MKFNNLNKKIVLFLIALLVLASVAYAGNDKAALGSISVSSNVKGSKVYLNDEHKGNAGLKPLLLKKLEPGTYDIKVTKKGYSDFSTTVTVNAGETTSVNVELTLKPGALNGYRVISNTPSSQVTIGQDAQWTEDIDVNKEHKSVVIELPLEASNVHVKSVKVKGKATVTADLDSVTVVAQTDDFTTVTVNLDKTNKNFNYLELVYMLPGPEKEESLAFIDDAKKIRVSSPFHYTNVVASTKLNNPLPEELVELKHVTADGTKEAVIITNYIDGNGDGFIDEVEWVVPHLSTEDYVIALHTTFNNVRADNPNLPSGWYIQGDGISNVDDGCLEVSAGAWVITNESYSGFNGAMYIPELDQIACGIKLPSFLPGSTGVMNLSLNFKTNFTNPEPYMELLNYGYYNLCDVGFNNNGLTRQIGCHAEITDLGNGWKRLDITEWNIIDETQAVKLFIAPSSLLYQQFGETGTMILDDVRITLP